jgi:hypothetical protein
MHALDVAALEINGGLQPCATVAMLGISAPRLLSPHVLHVQPAVTPIVQDYMMLKRLPVLYIQLLPLMPRANHPLPWILVLVGALELSAVVGHRLISGE